MHGTSDDGDDGIGDDGMAMRYDTLSATKSAYQAALPHELMRTLHARLGVEHECVACTHTPALTDS